LLEIVPNAAIEMLDVSSLLSVQQWDPGGSILNDDCIQRIIGERYYGAQEDFRKVWSLLKWYVVHILIIDFSVIVVATSSVFMFDCANGLVVLCHVKATMRIASLTHKKGMVIFSLFTDSLTKYKRTQSMRLLVQICSRIFLSWFIACVDLLVLPNGNEVNGCSLRFLFDRNHFLSTTLIEMLRQLWNAVMGTLEEMKPGFAFGMMFLHTIILNIPWNLGELNFPMAPTICIYCWSDLCILHGMPSKSQPWGQGCLKGWVLIGTRI
jgi:hypothetical protein